MGWTETTARPEVERIFKKANLRYIMKRVVEPYPVVQIEHEKTLSISAVREILSLFPDFVYVEFVPNIRFPENARTDTFDFVEE